MIEEKLKLLEESCFEQSGLSSHGCLENLDDYARLAIKKYGRILLKNYIENQCKLDNEAYTETKYAIRHNPTQKWVHFVQTDFDFFVTTIELVDFKDCLFVSNKDYLEMFLKRSVLNNTPNYGSDNFLEFEFVKIKTTYTTEQ